MQDINKIMDDIEGYRQLIKNKNMNFDLDELVRLYNLKKDFDTKIENLRQERNLNVEKIKSLKSAPTPELIEKGKLIKEQIAQLEVEQKTTMEEYEALMFRTPQFVSQDTPVGKDESENVPTKYYGKKPEFKFEIKDHIQLATDLDLIDFDRGVKVHGYRGYFLKNELAAMHLGLMMHSLQIMMKNGFTPIVAPALVKDFTMWNSGEFPFGNNVFEVKSTIADETGESQKDKYYLAGTAEVPLVSMHANEIFKLEELPKKYVGFSPCYRSEVGSYGKDTKGIYRIHEFMKIEQVVICENDYAKSTKLQEEMIDVSHQILDSLGLHYRDLQICTGDMGVGKYRMFDIETWMPGRDAYGETHSASNLGDWQSRRANIKFVNADGKKEYVHMLNNTALASPRILIAVLENFQNEDGSVTVPEALRTYVGKDVIVRK